MRRIAPLAGFLLILLTTVGVSLGEISAVAENGETVETTAATGPPRAVAGVRGSEVQFFSIGITGDGESSVNGITFTLSDLSEATGLGASDFAELRLYWSTDGKLDGDDAQIGRLGQEKIELGSPTAFPATSPHLSPIDVEIFYIVSAVIAEDAIEGHAFKVGFEGGGVGTGGGDLGSGFAADDASAITIGPVPDPASAITAYPATMAPRVDGRIATGEYADAVPVDVNFLDPRTVPGVAMDMQQPDEADLSFTMYATYTSTDLYLAFDVTDDVLIGDSPGEPHNDDYVQIYFDGDLVSNDLTLGWSSSSREGFTIIHDIADEGGGPGEERVITGANRRVHEFRVPLAEIDVVDGAGVTVAGAGSMIGFNVNIGDVDVPGTLYRDNYDPTLPNSRVAWVSAKENGNWPDHKDENFWGRLFFSPRSADEGEARFDPPELTLSRERIDFGDIAEEEEKTEKIVIGNAGNQLLEASLQLGGDEEFSIGIKEIALEPGSVELEVAFAPAPEGDYAGLLVIESNDPERGSVSIPISGKRSPAPRLNYSRRGISFGALFVRSRDIEVSLFRTTETVLFRNEGESLLEMTLALAGNSGFELSTGEVTLVPGESEEVAIGFTPPADGNYAAVLMIESNDPENREVTIPLSGSGVSGEDPRRAPIDPRRSDEWEQARRINLGPKAGNIERGAGIVLDRKRNRAFIGSTWGPAPHGIGRVSLQLGVVTDVIGQEAFGSGFGQNGRSLGLSEARDELYVLDNEGVFLQILDLNTLSLKNEVDLEEAQGGKRLAGNAVVDKMVVDEVRNRLYGVARQPMRVEGLEGEYSSASMWAVDLVNGEVIASIPLRATTDYALDRENQLIYATNGEERVIEVIDLESFQIKETIPAPGGLVPGGVVVDSTQPFLYVYAIDPAERYRSRDDLRPARLARVDPRTGDVDKQLSIRYWADQSQMAIDAATRTLWFALGRESLKIDLENFSVLRKGFLPQANIAGLAIDQAKGEVLALARLINLLYTVDMETGVTTSSIELGALPTGIDVSEVHNQVYVNRGGQGGFSVFDAAGNMASTIEAGEFDDIVVNDAADRLYGVDNRGAGAADLIYLYELSTLRLLDIVELTNFGWVYRIDLKMIPEQGVMWASAPPGLVKLDMYTGEILEEITTYDILPGIWMMELAPSGEKAYLVNISPNRTDHKNVYIFDLKEKAVVKTIETSLDRTILHAVDPINNRLYVSGQSGTEGNVLVVIDTQLDEVAEVKNLAYLVTSDSGMRGAIFDFEEGSIYHIPTSFGYPDGVFEFDSTGPKGWVTDLETGAKKKYGEFTTFAQIARNEITNTVYAVSTGDGMTISLGPVGTEVAPPPPPAGVQATAGDEKASLSWSAVDDPILAGYHVYRRDRPEGDFTRITRAPLVDTTFTDIGLTNEQTYAYYLTSVGQANLESHAGSDTVSVAPVGGANYRLLALRQSVSVGQGEEESIPLSVEILEGFDQEVVLSAVASEGLEVIFEPEKFVPPQVVNVLVKAGADAQPGRFAVTLEGSGEEKKTAEISVEVTKTVKGRSLLTLELDQGSVPLGTPLVISGRLFPGTQTQVRLELEAEEAGSLISLTVETDAAGGYQTEFAVPFVDRWRATAFWDGDETTTGTQSRSAKFAVTSGKTRITCTSDLADDADLGFIATIKGRIYPSPGTVAVTLTLRRPDGTEEVLDGVLSGEQGFYGHAIRMDQAGVWQVEASWGGNDLLLGASSPAVAIPVQTDVGRVILMAGGQDSNRDVFWPTSNYLGNLAYTTFQKRRLVKEKIFYLNDRQAQDVDRDGFQEDVDDGATMGAWSDAWTWARERFQSDSPLYVYLVGKGQPTGLEIGDGEILTATQLLQDLSALEEATGAQATLIVDASHAGHFIRDLSNQGRHVIASTGLGPAFYQAEGYLSFSQYFLTDLFQGKSLQEAFLHTDKILRNLPGAFRQQDPGLEAEGNLIPNQPGDYLQTLDAVIGASFELGDLSPQIKTSSLSSVAGGAGKRVVTQTRPVFDDPHGPRLKLAKSLAEEGVEISARIDDPEGNLQVVRAMIIPPDASEGEELTQYPEVELQADSDGRWTGVYSGFLEEGVYPVILYAVDGAGNAAEPLRTTVLVEPPPPLPTGDFNGDGLVDFGDFFLFADAFGSENSAYDLDGSGLVDFGDFFMFADAFGGPLGKLLELAEEMLLLPTEYALQAPYPNPFNSEVVVKYSLPEEGEVELVVYNTLGQAVRRLAMGQQGMGHHRVVWDGRDDVGRGLATGMYLVQLRASEWRSDASHPADLQFRQVRKIAFVK